MIGRTSRRFGASALGPATICLLTAACGDYAVPLPGGYELVRVGAGEVLLSEPRRGVVVDINIDGYGVHGPIVVGHVSKPARPAEQRLPLGFKDESRPGYFIADTRTGDIKQGLDRQAWLSALGALGITKEPTLKKPSRFDRYF